MGFSALQIEQRFVGTSGFQNYTTAAAETQNRLGSGCRVIRPTSRASRRKARGSVVALHPIYITLDFGGRWVYDRSTDERNLSERDNGLPTLWAQDNQKARRHLRMASLSGHEVMRLDCVCSRSRPTGQGSSMKPLQDVILVLLGGLFIMLVCLVVATWAASRG